MGYKCVPQTRPCKNSKYGLLHRLVVHVPSGCVAKINIPWPCPGPLLYWCMSCRYCAYVCILSGCACPTFTHIRACVSLCGYWTVLAQMDRYDVYTCLCAYIYMTIFTHMYEYSLTCMNTHSHVRIPYINLLIHNHAPNSYSYLTFSRLYLCMHACMYVCMYVCIHACLLLITCV